MINEQPHLSDLLSTIMTTGERKTFRDPEADSFDTISHVASGK